MSARRPPTPLPLFTRLTALTGAALVLLLTIFAASPQLHALLHARANHAGHDHAAHAPADSAHSPATPDTDDDLCVVTQFSHGGSELAVAPALLAPVSLCQLATLSVAPISVAATPAHTLPPGCGPPAV